MTREEALEKIAIPAFDPEKISEDFEYIATKLGITVEELRALHDGPKNTFRDFKNNMALMDLGAKVLRATGVQRAIIR